MPEDSLPKQPALFPWKCEKCGAETTSKPDKCNSCSRITYAKNREAIRKHHNEWYRQNRDSQLANKKARGSAVKEQFKRSFEKNKHKYYARKREKLRTDEGLRIKTAEYKKKYVAMNADRLKKQNAEYRKTNKEEISRQRKEGRERNRDKIKAQKKADYEKHKDKYFAAVHRRESQKKGAEGKFSASDVNALFKLQKGKCAACSVKIVAESGNPKRFHIDHVMPLSKGGSNWPTNLQLLCEKCNLSKHSMLPEEWAKRHGRLFC